jgi:hypothetical protein
MTAPPGTILQFLRELRSTGTPVIRLSGQGSWRSVLPKIEAEAANDHQLTSLLAAWHAEAAEDLGGPALAFDEAAALHGATLLFRAAWCYLHRDSTAAEVTQLLHLPAPGPLDPAAQFSADLTLQHLPSLHRMAQALAPGDPLLPALQQLAQTFPLASPGLLFPDKTLPDPDPSSWHALRSHLGLWQLFLDRVLQRQDRLWLAHPDVLPAVHHALGAHAKALAPFLLPA